MSQTLLAGLNESEGYGPAAAILDWLAIPIDRDIGADLPLMLCHLGTLAELHMPATRRQRILDVIQMRAGTHCARLTEQLACSALPLSAELWQMTEELREAENRLAQGYASVLHRLDAGAARPATRAASRGMQSVLAQFELGALAGMPPADDVWRHAGLFFQHCRRDLQPDIPHVPSGPDGDHLFRLLLAMHLAQPHGLAPSEWALVKEYADCFGSAVQVQAHPPHRDLDAWYRIDLDGEYAPRPMLGSASEVTGSSWTYVSCLRLAQLLQQHLDQANETSVESPVCLPPMLDKPAARQLLKRIQPQWQGGSKRHFQRRSSQQAARMAIGFQQIWALLHLESQAHHCVVLSEWILTNTSAGGLGARHVEGDTGVLRPGSLVVVSENDSLLQMACVVRWARAGADRHPEIGLEILGAGMTAVSVAFRPAHEGAPIHRGLTLPALGNIRPRPAIVFERGQCLTRRLILIEDAPGRLRVNQSKVMSLGLQTHALEMFELEDDPYPV